MIFIASGTYSQARYWAKQLGLLPDKFTYVRDPRVLYGREPGNLLLLCGLYYTHPEGKEILYTAKERKFIVLEVTERLTFNVL